MDLYQKYRPVDFDSVYGNEQIVSALSNYAADLKKCPHVFLLHGPTGCGKTTLARIFANAIGVATDSPDYKEINSSDFRGIDTIRELNRVLLFKGLSGKNRVYVIDECHKLTNDAQNAFLKKLEDTPPHVYFVLCTTEPGKLIKAIQNRCTQLQVKTLDVKQTKRLLKRVVKAEKDQVDDSLLEMIAEQSQGHARQALKLLQNVLAVSEEQREGILNQFIEESGQVSELCRALLDSRSNWSMISNILKSIKEIDPETIRRQALGYFQAVLLSGKTNGRAIVAMELFLEPTYNSGFPQIVYACYCTLHQK